MRRILISLVASAAIFGAASGLVFADEYPPCKSKSDDRCTQMPAGAMPSMGHKAKTMGHKAGAKMMKKEGHKAMMKAAPAGEKAGAVSPSPSTTRGCSPATTPCQ